MVLAVNDKTFSAWLRGSFAYCTLLQDLLNKSGDNDSCNTVQPYNAKNDILESENMLNVVVSIMSHVEVGVSLL